MPHNSTLYFHSEAMRYLLTLLLFCVFKIAHSDEFELVDPVQIENLSLEISKALTKEGCKIPKWKYGFGSVATGEFAEKGQTDIAVICIKDGISTIKVFWGGEKTCPSKIESNGQFINAVNEKYIADRYHEYGGTKPPPITHEAINDHFVEKGSIVRYCYYGSWIELTGSD